MCHVCICIEGLVTFYAPIETQHVPEALNCGHFITETLFLMTRTISFRVKQGTACLICHCIVMGYHIYLWFNQTVNCFSGHSLQLQFPRPHHAGARHQWPEVGGDVWQAGRWNVISELKSSLFCRKASVGTQNTAVTAMLIIEMQFYFSGAETDTYS